MERREKGNIDWVEGGCVGMGLPTQNTEGREGSLFHTCQGNDAVLG